MRNGIVPAAGGTALWLSEGQQLRVIDSEGGQTGDLVAFSADGKERLSNGRSFDYEGTIYLSTGNVLWSDLSNPMLTIVADDVGKHDFLYASCSVEMYRREYHVVGDHPNCVDNLCMALESIGVDPRPLPPTFNFFMNARVSGDGGLTILPPTTSPGKSVTFRAEMDLAIGLSACPGVTCNGGAMPRSLAYEVF
ncbi:MAG: urea carboxylase-associated family protein [Sphingomonas sp.]|uniref:DUF1989 domain-containing protein n=1 Tax=Sphingomonas sp. TaxID=28214 RepID=UPI003564B854